MNSLFRNFHNLIFSIVFTIVLTPSLESQNKTSKTDYYNWFDGVINQSNSGLFKGIEYFERFKSINERHQYFNTNNFSNGSVIFKDSTLNFFITSDKRVVLTKSTIIYSELPEYFFDKSGQQITQNKIQEAEAPIFMKKEDDKINASVEIVRIRKQQVNSTKNRFTLSGVIKNPKNNNPIANMPVFVKKNLILASPKLKRIL